MEEIKTFCLRKLAENMAELSMSEFYLVLCRAYEAIEGIDQKRKDCAERQKMMQSRADYLDRLNTGTKVIPLRRQSV